MIRSKLERTGRPIGHNDLLIAAHAGAHGATFVTNDAGEFRRVPALAIEDWQQRLDRRPFGLGARMRYLPGAASDCREERLRNPEEMVMPPEVRSSPRRMGPLIAEEFTAT